MHKQITLTLLTLLAVGSAAAEEPPAQAQQPTPLPQPGSEERATEPAPDDPATADPAAAEPAAAEPAAAEPATAEPAAAEPAAAEPATTEPAAAEPATTEPAAAEPATAEPAPEPAPAEPLTRAPAITGSADPATALEEADRLLDAGEVGAAQLAYQKIVTEFPDTVQGAQAQRSLRAIGRIGPGKMRLDVPKVSPGATDRVYGVEPYSLGTGERLNINVWEMIDFVATAFGYGMSVGGSWAAAIEASRSPYQSSNAGTIIVPLIVGSLTYTAGALLYLFLADPDRGDLPLALGVSSYLPISATLVAILARAQGDAVGWTSAIFGTLAMPLALWVGSITDLDPGDTQLARDSGFWLGGASAAMAAGIAEATRTSYYGQIDPLVVAGAGLVGLWAGVGLGVLGAAFSEVSLERVRVTTWAGYGGTGIGALIGGLVLTGSSNASGFFFSTVAGGVTGLLIGFLTTSALDELPDDVHFIKDEPEGAIGNMSFMTPTVLPSRDRDGTPGVAFGLSLAQGTF